jgi:hypothetical protein
VIYPVPKIKAIRLEGKEYTKFREEVFLHFGGICQDCKKFFPLRDNSGQFDLFNCGHVSHIKGRAAGGSDTLDNVKWRCFGCHNRGIHGLKFSKKD